MKLFVSPLLVLLAFWSAGCRSYNDPAEAANAVDLFKEPPADTSLFAPAVDSSLLMMNTDSAFKKSTAVVAATISSIDSTVHGGEAAPFYLLTAHIDTAIKGILRKNSALYFVMMKRPPGGITGKRWWCYLAPAAAQSLPAKSGIAWQWLRRAPFLPYVSEPLRPPGTIRPPLRTRRHKRRYHHWRKRLH